MSGWWTGERGMSKSISSEWTFTHDTDDPTVLGERLAKMVADVGASLRREGLVAHTVMVKFRLTDFTTYTRQKTVTNGLSEDAGILALATTILARTLATRAKTTSVRGRRKQLNYPCCPTVDV